MRKGSHMSEEAKQKISKSMIEVRKTINPMKGRTGNKHPNYGKPMSEEQKKKLSESHKGKPSNRKGVKLSDETKQKISESKKGNIPWNKGMKTGPHSKEHNMNIAIGVCDHPVGRGEWYEAKNGKLIWMRSSYEIRVATVLDRLDIVWKYEPNKFKIGNSVYIPDFLIEDDVWWEVKGYMDDISRNKILKFQEQYPNEIIRVVYLESIKKLEEFSENNIKFDSKQQGIKLSEQ